MLSQTQLYALLLAWREIGCRQVFFFFRFSSIIFLSQGAIGLLPCSMLQTGRKPSGLCGAALYIAALSHGHNYTKADIVSPDAHEISRTYSTIYIMYVLLCQPTTFCFTFAGLCCACVWGHSNEAIDRVRKYGFWQLNGMSLSFHRISKFVEPAVYSI